METGRECIVEEFRQRKLHNSLYSLRAFARDLGIGKSSLCDFFVEKRLLSKKNVQKVAKKLGLTPLQVKTINGAEPDPAAAEKNNKQLVLEEDLFRLIADWYYLAILNLAKIPSHSAKPAWIARRLGINLEDAEEAVSRLARLGLLSLEKGKLKRTALPLSTSRDIPSEAIRKHHRHQLRLALESLQEDSLEEREFGAVTMAINLRHLQKAKEFLHRTKKRLSSVLEKDEPEEVYIFSFQLFPVKNRKREDLQ